MPLIMFWKFQKKRTNRINDYVYPKTSHFILYSRYSDAIDGNIKGWGVKAPKFVCMGHTALKQETVTLSHFFSIPSKSGKIGTACLMLSVLMFVYQKAVIRFIMFTEFKTKSHMIFFRKIHKYFILCYHFAF